MTGKGLLKLLPYPLTIASLWENISKTISTLVVTLCVLAITEEGMAVLPRLADYCQRLQWGAGRDAV